MKQNRLEKKFQHSEDPNFQECVAKHLPKWVGELDWQLFQEEIGRKEYDHLRALVNRYNELIDYEEGEAKGDAHAQFGVEEEKKDLLDAILKVYEKYKHLAGKKEDKLLNKLNHQNTLYP